MNEIILAALERGLSMSDIRRMQIGQLVDFCVDYNNRQKRSEAKAERDQRRGSRRRASQNDINAFFG